jgi:hypothetical protein
MDSHGNVLDILTPTHPCKRSAIHRIEIGILQLKGFVIR